MNRKLINNILFLQLIVFILLSCNKINNIINKDNKNIIDENNNMTLNQEIYNIISINLDSFITNNFSTIEFNKDSDIGWESYVLKFNLSEEYFRSTG